MHLQPPIDIPARSRLGEPITATVRAHDCSFVNSFNTVTLKDQVVIIGSHFVPTQIKVNDVNALATVRESNNSVVVGYQVYAQYTTLTPKEEVQPTSASLTVDDWAEVSPAQHTIRVDSTE